MTETLRTEKQLDGICRVLMAAGMLVILAGYFSWFKTKRQLVSPLIPKSTVDTIYSDGSDIIFKACICAAVFFLCGLWAYTFQRKKIAIGFFLLSILGYWAFPFFA